MVKAGDLRIRKAEHRTQDASGVTGVMKTYYYLSNDKLYTFSVLGSDATFAGGDSSVARVLNEIKILG